LYKAHIGSFLTPLEAELARSVLESAGIPSRIEGDTLAGAAQWVQGTDNVRIFVADENAEEAQRLIQEHDRALTAERRRADTLDEKATRAYRMTLIGWMILPVVAQAISMFTLVRLPYSKLSKTVRRRYRIAMLFNLIVLGSVAYALLRSVAT
jgi:Putative prokaryotic signal transducing protein